MTWKNSNYSSSDIMSMQQDAIRRVREMQRIANSRVHGEATPVFPFENSDRDVSEQNTKYHQPLKRAETSAAQTPVSKKTSVPNSNFIEDLLKRLNLDNDKMIILLLLIVLMNEGTDSKLLLALCYLLL